MSDEVEQPSDEDQESIPMARLIYLSGGDAEAFVIDTECMSNDELERVYGLPVFEILTFTPDQTAIVSMWPTDKLLEI